MKPLRIMLVDDHEVVRVGLRTLLARRQDFEVVGEASTAKEAVEKALQLRPDVVVMDVRLPGKSGIQACRQIVEQAPEVRVIMLTSYAEDELLFEAVAAGASGYILKQIGSEALFQALERVGCGESLLDPSLTRTVLMRLREAIRKEKADAFRDLTDQELKILPLLAEGKTNREIAREVFLSEKTVRNYVSSILSKLGLSTRAQAAAYAVEHGLKRTSFD